MIIPDKIGFNIFLLKLIFNLILFLKAVYDTLNAIIWHTIELIGAPYIFIIGLLIKITFKISFTVAPIAKAIAGIWTLFRPCNPLFIVWFIATNIIAIAANLKTPAPSDADGYINFKIGSANVINPIAQGIIIKIEIKTEKDNLLLVVS